MESKKINELAQALEDAMQGHRAHSTNKDRVDVMKQRMTELDNMEGHLRTVNMLDKASNVIQLLVLGQDEAAKKQTKDKVEAAQKIFNENNFTIEDLAGRKAIMNAKEEIICPYLPREIFDITVVNFMFLIDELPEDPSQEDIELCLRYSVKLMTFSLEGISKVQEVVFKLAEEM